MVMGGNARVVWRNVFQFDHIWLFVQSLYGLWNLRILYSRPGKSWNFMVSHGKL